MDITQDLHLILKDEYYMKKCMLPCKDVSWMQSQQVFWEISKTVLVRISRVLFVFSFIKSTRNTTFTKMQQVQDKFIILIFLSGVSVNNYTWLKTILTPYRTNFFPRNLNTLKYVKFTCFCYRKENNNNSDVCRVFGMKVSSCLLHPIPDSKNTICISKI